MPGFWQKPICLHRHVTPIPTHSWSLFPLASQPHDLWKAHSFHLIPAILLVYVSYILLLHLNYIWDSPYLYCNVNSFLGLLTDSQGEFVFQAAFQVPQDVALPHRPFGTSAKPPSCAPLTDLWTHHTPFGVNTVLGSGKRCLSRWHSSGCTQRGPATGHVAHSFHPHVTSASDKTQFSER